MQQVRAKAKAAKQIKVNKVNKVVKRPQRKALQVHRKAPAALLAPGCLAVQKQGTQKAVDPPQAALLQLRVLP